MQHLGPVIVTTPSDREIRIERDFNASVEQVFAAMTKPELLKKWLLGPPGWEMTVCENDVRVGGTFRHAWRNSDGSEMSMHGAYREVSPPTRIVRTECFDTGCDSQAGEQIGTLELTDHGGKTHLQLTLRFPSKEARDGALASGMEHGMNAGYERLDQLLATA